jgi:hypothetical protein
MTIIIGGKKMTFFVQIDLIPETLLYHWVAVMWGRMYVRRRRARDMRRAAERAQLAAGEATVSG